MNFDLSAEQTLLKKMIKEFAEAEVAPGALERDKNRTLSLEIFKKLAQLGMMGLPFPEEYGGADADTISFAIVTEELSRACGSTGITYSAHISLGGAPLHLFGTEDKSKNTLFHFVGVKAWGLLA